MNWVFLFLLFAGLLTGCYQILFLDQPAALVMMTLTQGLLEAAKNSVGLVIGLIGVMAFFLGLMKVAEKGGLLHVLARTVYPLMTRLFPDVPAHHPAMGSMILNISANMMGLGNAATPFGLKAMEHLETLNRHPGTSTNAMALFLALNTSNVTLLPTGIIALRASAGSADPAGILLPTLFATFCSTLVAIIAAKSYAKFFPAPQSLAATNAPTLSEDEGKDEGAAKITPYSRLTYGLILSGLLAFVALLVLLGGAAAPWLIPLLVFTLLLFGVVKRVSVYQAFIEGASEAFELAIKIIPYLVAILTAIAIFRLGGAMDLLLTPLAQLTGPLGLPKEALPMAMLRPLSGSGAYGIVADTLSNPNIGPDSYVGYLVSTLQGSTETTFYVLAVYAGAIRLKNLRHALPAALTADLAGIIAAVFICNQFFG